jgi:RNA polymerase sigma factor (sigma-70 family)
MLVRAQKAMTELLRRKRPAWNDAEIQRVVAFCIAAGESARRCWTPNAGISRKEFVARSMRAEIERELISTAPRSGIETTPFVTPTDPHSVQLLNRKSDEDEESRIREISAALAKLPLKWRRIVLLRFYHGLTVEEIGQALGLSKSWTSRLANDALHRFHILYLQCADRRRWGRQFRSSRIQRMGVRERKKSERRKTSPARYVMRLAGIVFSSYPQISLTQKNR